MRQVTWAIGVAAALTGAAAQGMEPEYLYEENAWLVAFTGSASETEAPDCSIGKINTERPTQSIHLYVLAPDEARLTIIDHGWGAKPPALPLGFAVDGESWDLDWTPAGLSADAQLGSVLEIGPIWEALAAGQAMRLTDAGGGAIMEIALEGNEAAFAALRDCVATRLDPSAE
jgi:hypothetical protein